MMDATGLLKLAVSSYSPSGRERKLAEFLQSYAKKAGFESGIDEAGNFIARTGGSGKRILLLGHLDTVPGVIPVRAEKNQLYGRGSVDAKGSLCAMLCAASQWLGKADITVAGVIEEETASSKGARHILKTMQEPDFAIIGEPSSWQGMTIGYKGRLVIGYKNKAGNRHAAGSMPNPIQQALEFCNAAHGLTQRIHSPSPFNCLHCSVTSFNTINNGLTSQAQVLLEFRTPPGFDFNALKEFLVQQAGPATLSFHGQENAVVSQKNNALIRALIASIREQGGSPAFKKKTGTSDMNVLAGRWNCPMAAYGPGDSSLDHTPDEHIDLEEYAKAISVLGSALGRIKH